MTAQVRTDDEQELVARLLGLYSVQKLRHHFQPEATLKEEMIAEIATTASRNDIVEFVVRYHPTTKHRLHLFEYPETDLGQLPADPLGMPDLVRTRQSASRRTWFYLVTLTHHVYLRNPLEVVPLEFLWPIEVSCTALRLQIRFTLMEKSMRSRFDRDRFIRSVESFDEATIQGLINANLPLLGATVVDLNKGVKELWESGIIDAPAVQWKDPRAVTRQIMDAKYLLKRDNPERYGELHDKPLYTVVFKWLGDADVGLDHFTVDATKGVFTFRTYSDLEKGASHVVDEVLARND